MPVVLIPIFIIVAIVVAVAIARGARTWGQRRVETHDELAGPATTLDYVVPSGQDPALLVSALRQDGYEAAPDPRDTDVLHIECPGGLDRERPRVRATLQSVRRTGFEGAPMDPEPVRFADEV